MTEFEKLVFALKACTEGVDLDQYTLNVLLKGIEELREEKNVQGPYKIKLTKLEYEVIRYLTKHFPYANFSGIDTLVIMKKNGFFKGILCDDTLQAILKNCEVVDG